MRALGIGVGEGISQKWFQEEVKIQASCLNCASTGSQSDCQELHCKTPARKLMTWVMGPLEPATLPSVAKCDALPPAEPNVYTDGTNSQPRWHQFALGAFGTWWKDRTLSTHPLSTTEETVVNAIEGHGSTGTFQHLPSPSMSSMRAELAGGVAAACANGPMHLASDNLGFVIMATKIIENPQAFPHKPWGTTANGDLWQLFHNIVVQKGANALRVSWTKGHCDG